MRQTPKVHRGMGDFGIWLRRLFSQPVFLFVTLWGHVSILAGAFFYRYFESPHNPRAESFFDAYYWAISMATTVGTSDLAPVTVGGKLVAIAVMVVGSLFLWSYAALFAASVVVPAVRQFGEEVKGLEADVQEMERDVKLDKLTVEKLVRELEEFNRKRLP